MLVTRICPRFCDTDALGHINNTVIPVWFLEAREPIYRWFSSDVSAVPLAVVRLEVDYLAETHFGVEVEVRSQITRIGNSSFQLQQELWQGELLTARGLTTLVNFDQQNRKSLPLPEAVKQQMSKHLLSGEDK